MMRQTIVGNTLGRSFEDVSDFLAYVQRPTKQADNLRSSITGTEKFTGTKSLDEAVELARRGWTGGNQYIERFRADIERMLEGVVPVPEPRLRVQGAVVHIGRYLQGRPDCLIHREDSTMHRHAALPKIIRVVCNVSASQGVGEVPLIMRGAAICVLLDTLARYRVHCSVDLVSTWSTSVVNPDAPKLEFKLPLKHESDNVNIAKLAYFLGHPAVIRRLIYSAMEHEDEATRRTFGIGRDMGGYGIPATADHQGDIYIDRIRTASDWSPNFAMAWLRHQLINQGIELKEI